MILRDVAIVWVAGAASLFLTIYLGIHLADLIIDKKWHW